MKSHGSAEELFKHYEAVHNSGIDSTRGGEGHLSPERWNAIHLCLCFCVGVELLLITPKAVLIWTLNYVVKYWNVHIPFPTTIKKQLETYIDWYWYGRKWESVVYVFIVNSINVFSCIWENRKMFKCGGKILVHSYLHHRAEISSLWVWGRTTLKKEERHDFVSWWFGYLLCNYNISFCLNRFPYHLVTCKSEMSLCLCRRITFTCSRYSILICRSLL